MKIACLLVGVLMGLWGYGQGYDVNWVSGNIPLSTMDFVNDTVALDSFPNGLFFTITDASISDENGNFLYYTNGISINNAQGIVPNGDSLSPCWYTDQYSIAGLNINQGALFIPQPDKPGYYYLFHYSNDALDSTRPSTLYYSLIEHEENGYDTVVLKNISFFQDTVLRGGGMTACKHANGRDYWLVIGASVVNKFYKFLVTRSYVYGPYIQNIGPEFPLPFDNAYSKFSLDGSKYATGTIEGPVLIMDFDRCSGEFSNPDTIFNEASTDPEHDPLSGCVSVEFSPNGRFLYVSDVNNLNQYDLLSGNIQDSVQVYLADSNDAALIDKVQIGPNGKLYGCTWNGGVNFYHVVNYPDLKGDSCNFVWGGQRTYSLNSASMSNMINYNLGPLIGSGCDTIPASVTSLNASDVLRVLPNPADKYIYVEAGNQADYEFDLLNSLGQVIDKKQTRQVDIFDTENLASGIYLVRVRDSNTGRAVGVRRVVVEH